MISASTQCADVGWYSKVEPGSQFSRQLANFSTRPSRVHCCGGPSGAYGKPEVCSITCSTVIDVLAVGRELRDEVRDELVLVDQTVAR